MSSLKVLVCGDVEGNFKTLFTKVGTLHKKKGPFEFLLCVGDFFSSDNEEWNDVVSGKILVPLVTYVLGPNRAEHLKFYPKQGSELATDVIYLGARGIFTGATGLKIAYVSGVEKNESTRFSFTQKDISEMVNSSSSNPVDILLTSQWPKGVTKHAAEIDDSKVVGSKSIAFLAKKLKPRYHFCGYSQIFYERLPYRNHQVLIEKPLHSTRFIALAPLDNKTKQKWLYAFNIVPFESADREVEKSDFVTECPYDEEVEHQFFYDINSSNKSKRQNNENHRSDSKKQRLQVTHDDCWFCLTNPKVEKQLIISIGDYSYITIAKGGLSKDHLLIIPLEHVQATRDLQGAAEDEIQRYKRALVRYFNDSNKDVVFSERNYMSPHLQLQVIPVSKSKSSKIPDVLNELASCNGLEFTELSPFASIKELVSSKDSYFHLEVVINKKTSASFMHLIKRKFPLQFVRMVLADEAIMNAPDKVDWKNCKLPLSEEEQIVETIKAKFEPYDFTKE